MNFMFFKELIELLNTRPIVPGKTADCLHLWETYTARQQEYIYTTIRAKLQDGKFVHYDPVKAIKENFPKPQIIPAEKYYAMYNTQNNCDGWVRTFLPDQHKTVYVKQIK